MATPEHLHLVTGKLAANALNRVAAELQAQARYRVTVEVLPISVAALMTTEWALVRVHPPEGTTRVILPGYCGGELPQPRPGSPLIWERGPKDLRDLPAYLNSSSQPDESYGTYDIEILAEINHAPRWALPDFLGEARRLSADGADVIDVGCEPAQAPWTQVGQYVRALRDLGLRVSIDSMHVDEIARATAAGAELVLSVNRSNRDAAADWGCEVVAIPDHPADPASLGKTLEVLEQRQVPFRADPILEPIGFGFAASLRRFFQFRESFPETSMLMGIGNLTELTDVDSAAVNLLLLAICQELRIHSVLTTQVIPWARTSVRECDLARRMVHYACSHQVLPKHLDSRLLLLRDPLVREFTPSDLQRLASQLRDANYRIFVSQGQIHAMNREGHWCGEEPFALFEQLQAQASRPLDASHAFYLGYELCKAAMALQLGKGYEQDEALHWGFLTVPEDRHRLRKTAEIRARLSQAEDSSCER